MMKRAIIYARVSSKRQADDGLPMESQIEQCRLKAQAMGADVLREFVDGGISGTTDKRPAFQEAISFCSLMDVDYFITWSSSRFARNLVDAQRYKLLLQASRTRLMYVTGDIDVTTDDGWLMDGFNALLDENYSRRVSTDTRRSMLKASRDGFFMGGRVPFGYKAVPDGKRRKLAPEPAEAEIVKRIFGMALQGLGVKLIALELNQAGQLLRGAKWAKNTLNYMLHSEIYMGISIFNRVRNRVLNPEEVWTRVESHPAIIDKTVFDQVQLSVDSRRPERSGGQARSKAVFAGLLRCGECGGALTTTNGTSRNGDLYFYYGCGNHMRGKESCTFKNVRVDNFDPWLISQLLDKVLTPQTVQRVAQQVLELSAGWAKDRRLRREAIVKELRETEGKRTKLYNVLELMGREAPNLADMGPRLRVLNEQLRNLELSLIKFEEEPTAPNDTASFDPDEVAGVLRGLVQDCADPKVQRTFMGSFIEKATVSGDSVAVFYNEGRMMSLGGDAVRRGGKWLPVWASVRTKKLLLERPGGRSSLPLQAAG
jgi:site-specific DNA recombinase